MATQTGRALWGVLQAFDRACESNKDFLKRPEDGICIAMKQKLSVKINLEAGWRMFRGLLSPSPRSGEKSIHMTAFIW